MADCRGGWAKRGWTPLLVFPDQRHTGCSKGMLGQGASVAGEEAASGKKQSTFQGALPTLACVQYAPAGTQRSRHFPSWGVRRARLFRGRLEEHAHSLCFLSRGKRGMLFLSGHLQGFWSEITLVVPGGTCTVLSLPKSGREGEMAFFFGGGGVSGRCRSLCISFTF